MKSAVHTPNVSKPPSELILSTAILAARRNRSRLSRRNNSSANARRNSRIVPEWSESSLRISRISAKSLPMSPSYRLPNRMTVCSSSSCKVSRTRHGRSFRSSRYVLLITSQAGGLSFVNMSTSSASSMRLNVGTKKWNSDPNSKSNWPLHHNSSETSSFSYPVPANTPTMHRSSLYFFMSKSGLQNIQSLPGTHCEDNSATPGRSYDLLARAGAILNFLPSVGTGAGGTAQETRNLTFSQKA